ncbi:MAG: class I SAM-dependent methyltransferase [Endomicrobia bacterium]|nr:class I SAM-dependent methyltransferase [Endomicrobiia bacterium]
MKQKIDWNLKFFRDIFELECLHFGYWDNSLKEINLENLKKAQQLYIDVLIQKIPKDVKTVLDVGCGTGEVAKNLLLKNFVVECVSPDNYQYSIVKKKLQNITFHLTKFEYLVVDKQYDLVLMAESCQYLNLELMFIKLKQVVSQNGYVLISDYFRKSDIKYYRTTHIESEFKKYLKKFNFEIVSEEDITDNVLPTLTLAKKYYEKYLLPISEIIIGYTSEKMRLVSKIIKFFLKKKLKKINYYIYEHTKDKLNEKKFKENLVYKIFLLKNVN